MKVRRFYGDERGSFTIEANIVFPLIFLITLLLVFAALFFYQKTVLYYTATTVAERTAHIWDNSFKDPITGAHRYDEHDDLYWRWTQDRVSDMFGFIHTRSPETVHLPQQTDVGNTGDEAGVRYKLLVAAKQLKPHVTGTVMYSHRILQRSVQVSLERSMGMPGFTKPFLSDEMNVEADASVIDPVEFIRTVSLIESYAKQLQQYNVSRQAASDAIDEFLGIQSPATFAIHHDAHMYLMQLVDGREQHFETSHGTRMVDAFDPHHISHQAFLTFNTANLRLQLAKDAELLMKGDIVKGVVWHFFRRTGQTGRVGPSDSLLREIEEQGIVVVIHD